MKPFLVIYDEKKEYIYKSKNKANNETKYIKIHINIIIDIKLYRRLQYFNNKFQFSNLIKIK